MQVDEWKNEDFGEAHAEQQRKAEEIDGLMKPLCSRAGQKLLEHLEKQFVKRQIVRDNDTQFAAGIRQGEANIIRKLISETERISNGR